MEARSGQGIMSGREQFSVGLQNPVQPQQPQQPPPGMRLAFTPEATVVYKSLASSSPNYQTAALAGGATGGSGESTAPAVAPHGLNMNLGEPVKRKRGRPRKYGPDGAMTLGLAPVSPHPVAAAAPAGSGGFTPTAAVGVPPNSASSLTSASGGAMKKPRGRPPGSSGKKKQMNAMGSAGMGFTPHIITVRAGEDVSSKIMAFSQNGPRAVCILSANGAISNVTLRQAAMSGGTVTYEGRFEILSLSGSFLLSESGGQRSRTGGLSVSLAGPDGRVLGGGVAGLLTAASPVQVVVGSFMVDGRKESKQTNPLETSPTPANVAPGMAAGAGSPPSRGTLSESSPGPGSPLNHSSGACNNSNQQVLPGMPWK
ncbi:hypothetical protein Taro_039027 [Colocasia esculenta]|uniref:AT-hook motif nuclear-localized protein n=1 Tax=Colocasia esculenta TaxID=4460 RepID=A0A843WFG0_COLES|nr:hypothetical protein [Colocasia esculenta]